jgi:hypothetical protein
MAVLMIIVLMLTRVFRDATSAWTIGTRQMEDNVNGRAVLDFIARDISQAMISGENCSFRLRSSAIETYPGLWGNRADTLCFVSFSGDPAPTKREAEEIVYFVTPMYQKAGPQLPYRFALRRALRNVVGTTLTCYSKKYWWEDVDVTGNSEPVIAENIVTFIVWCTGSEVNAAGKVEYWPGLYDYNTLGDEELIVYPWLPPWYDKAKSLRYMKGKLPVYIDLYLETLGDEAATKAAQLFNAGLTAQGTNFVNQNVRKYYTRVSFVNRTGGFLDQ